MNSQFSTWLKDQMNKRQWGNRETARQAGINNATIGNLLSGKTPPTLANCTALAKAFDVPTNSVLRLAGLIEPVGPVTIRDDLKELLGQMSDDEQGEVLQHAIIIKERKKKYGHA